MQKIYSAYFTGQVGVSLGLFLIGDGKIIGVDVGGIAYDGTYQATDERLIGEVIYTVPPYTQLVSGQAASNAPIKVNLPLNIPVDFATREFVRIDTPSGPVNARFTFLRELP